MGIQACVTETTSVSQPERPHLPPPQLLLLLSPTSAEQNIQHLHRAIFISWIYEAEVALISTYLPSHRHLLPPLESQQPS